MTARDWGNVHLQLQRAIIENASMQSAMNKAIYKLLSLKSDDARTNKTINDIVDLLEGYENH